MYAVLNPDLALRGWMDAPHVLYIRNQKDVIFLSKTEFFLLVLANGFMELPDSPVISRLVKNGTIIPCEKGEKHLSEWQKFRYYKNHYMFDLNLMITGRCNYNCLHCFNAVDNARLQSELSFAELEQILDDARACGIYGVSLTGGEPMMHPDFDRILDAIYERELFVFQINTNGSLITKKFLDHLKRLGASPQIKISFDGIGCHDWMRNHKGAEQQAMEAIRLCVQEGFQVMIQYNVNKKTLPALGKTLEMLDSMGVFMCRIIQTIDTPRWVVNGKDSSFTYREYMDQMMKILAEYIRQPRRMILWFWQMAYVFPKEKAYSFSPVVKFSSGKFESDAPPCSSARRMMAIGSDGEVYPCLQMSGVLEGLGISCGNIHQQSLRELLMESSYMTCICHTSADRLKHNRKCQTCRFLKYCGMGCPGLALLNPEAPGQMSGYDPMKCIFFYDRYDLKMAEILEGYQDVTGVKIEG